MSTTLNVTGKPAQMGRGVLADVSGKLVERFAVNLAEQLSADTAPDGAAGTTAAAGDVGAAGPAEDTAEGSTEGSAGGGAGDVGAAAAGAAPTGSRAAVPSAAAPARKKEDETLNLLGVAAGPVMRRIIPAIGALARGAVFVAFWRGCARSARRRRDVPLTLWGRGARATRQRAAGGPSGP